MEKLLLLLLPLPFGIGFMASGPHQDPVPGTPLFSFTDSEIIESSGLAARDDLVMTINDSGDSNRVFTVDPATGDTVGVTRWQGDADDIEAVAPAGDGHVYVGDIGDNESNRKEIEVARVPFGRGNQTVDAVTYDFVYPDGAHDAETLLVHPVTGQLFVVAKEFIGRIYAAPENLKEKGRNTLSPVDEVLGIATDGSFFPDGKHLILRNYTQAAIYNWPDLDRIALFDLPEQEQGESLAVTEAGDVLIGTEGKNTEVLQVDLPADVRAEMAAGPTDEASDPGAAEPAAEAADVTEDERSLWPWGLGYAAGVVILFVLWRSLRSRP